MTPQNSAVLASRCTEITVLSFTFQFRAIFAPLTVQRMRRMPPVHVAIATRASSHYISDRCETAAPWTKTY